MKMSISVMAGEMLGLPLWNVDEGTAGVNAETQCRVTTLMMKSGPLGRFYINTSCVLFFLTGWPLIRYK